MLDEHDGLVGDAGADINGVLQEKPVESIFVWFAALPYSYDPALVWQIKS